LSAAAAAGRRSRCGSARRSVRSSASTRSGSSSGSRPRTSRRNAACLPVIASVCVGDSRPMCRLDSDAAGPRCNASCCDGVCRSATCCNRIQCGGDSRAVERQWCAAAQLHAMPRVAPLWVRCTSIIRCRARAGTRWSLSFRCGLCAPRSTPRSCSATPSVSAGTQCTTDRVCRSALVPLRLPLGLAPLRSVVHVVRCIVAAEHSHARRHAEAELSESRHVTAAVAAPKPPPPGTAAVRLNGRVGPFC
jgi:hypothetical protein